MEDMEVKNMLIWLLFEIEKESHALSYQEVGVTRTGIIHSSKQDKCIIILNVARN